MLRVLGLVLGLVFACTDTRAPAPVDAPAPARADPTMNENPTPPPPDELEPLARSCDGVAVAAAFAKLDAAALATRADGPSTRLLARWEAARSFSAEGSIEPGAVESFSEALKAELGSAPPRWWIEQLASAKLPADAGQSLPYYDVGSRESGDRRGELVPGPGSSSVRPDVAMALSETDGKLAFDLSLGRIELGPLPTEPDATLELARARAGTTLYYATFSRGSGGFRFPLRAIGSDGRERWRTEVCGPDRKILGGLTYLTVEILVLEPPPDPAAAGMKLPSRGPTGIAVFTAESHGVALDVFDPQTGERTIAWSSDFWFAR
ncbi:MAG: hypothetical protein R6X02_15180 [Enhygromyxa sp.]